MLQLFGFHSEILIVMLSDCVKLLLLKSASPKVAIISELYRLTISFVTQMHLFIRYNIQ